MISKNTYLFSCFVLIVSLCKVVKEKYKKIRFMLLNYFLCPNSSEVFKALSISNNMATIYQYGQPLPTLYLFSKPLLLATFSWHFSQMKCRVNTKIKLWGKVISSCLEDYQKTPSSDMIQNNDNFSYQKDKYCEWKTCWVRERALLLKKAGTLPMKISAYPLLEKTPLHELPSFLQGNLACLPEIILSQCTAFLKCSIYE